MSSAEYIFIDEPRLDKYVEQFTSETTSDKAPVWKALSSIRGPAAEGRQQRFARSLTTHEKLTTLLQYLRQEDLVAEGRPTRSTAEARLKQIERFWETGEEFDEEDEGAKEIPFRLENCLARRIRIQLPTFKLPDKYRKNLTENTNSLDINIWLSWPDQNQISDEAHHKENENEPSQLPGILYLLEGSPDDDEYWFVVGAVFKVVEVSNKLFSFILLHPDSKRDQEKVFRQVKSFSVSPFSTFETLGASVGPERRIKTLYRVRDTFTAGAEPCRRAAILYCVGVSP